MAVLCIKKNNAGLAKEFVELMAVSTFADWNLANLFLSVTQTRTFTAAGTCKHKC